MVLSREETAPVLGIPELLHHGGGQLACFIQVGRLGGGLKGADQGRAQECVVVQVAVESTDASGHGPEETAILVRALQQECEGLLGHSEILRISQRLIGVQDAGDHQAVPAGEDLLVAQGLDPPLADFQELASGVRHHLVRIR